MIKAKIKSKTNGKTQKLLKSLNKLSNNNLQVGHFEKSGIHYSNFSYPELLKIWAFGGPTGKVVKNPLAQYAFGQLMNKKFLKNPHVKKVYQKWSKNLLNENSAKDFLKEMGEVLRQEYSDVFGQAGVFMPIVGENTTPLVETGELKSKTAYKTSIDNIVKELVP